MKKIFTACLALALLLSLPGCKNEGGEDATEALEATEIVTEEQVVTKSFIGTVVDETDTYMIVEPDEGEEERELSEEIAVYYTTVHADYLYGEGRRVVVYYESDAINEKFEIVSDDISTEGFRDFKLVINENGNNKFEKVLVADEANEVVSFGHLGDVNVVTYGVDVTVNADGKSVKLKEALEKSFITPQAITVMANRDVRLNLAAETVYRDGGSREYVYDNYKIIKYHTEDGKRDLYIGNLNMKYTG